MAPGRPFLEDALRYLRLAFVAALGAAALVLLWFAFFYLLAEGVRLYLAAMQFTPSKVAFYADSIRRGAEVTLKLTVISALAGLVLGLFAGIAKLSRNPLFSKPATFYVWLVRGTPLLVQILFAYHALPQLLDPVWAPLERLGVSPVQDVLTEYWAAFIALSFNVGAYNAEVIRAGILAIPKGQWEAAQSLGLSQAQVMRYVVVPQALRIVIPPLVNNVVALLKDTSLAYTIGLFELVMAGQRIISATFRPVPIYLAVAAVYLLLTTVLTFFTNWLERRLRFESTH